MNERGVRHRVIKGNTRYDDPLFGDDKSQEFEDLNNTLTILIPAPYGFRSI